jgi:hypothetical protein
MKKGINDEKSCEAYNSQFFDVILISCGCRRLCFASAAPVAAQKVLEGLTVQPPKFLFDYNNATK